MKKKSRIRSICTTLFQLSILLLVCIACERNYEEEFEPQLNIFGVLTNILQTQEIIVDRTYPIDEPSGPVIDDALVVLSGNGFIDTLEFSYSSQKYLTEPLNVAPLTTYELIVEKDGFDTAHATTTVPGNFTIFFPLFNDTLTFQDTILFARSTAAALYSFVFVHYTGGFGPFFWYEPDPFDSLIQIPVGDYLDEPCTGLFTIYIVAYDSNFYEYYYPEDDSIAQAGVTGGVGLLGSTWTEATSVYVLFE
jgi:hypothetical protein